MKRSNRGTDEYTFCEERRSRRQTDMLAVGRDYLYQTVIVNGEKVVEAAVSCNSIGDVRIRSWSSWENGAKKENMSLRIHVADSGTRIAVPLGEEASGLAEVFNEGEKRQSVFVDIAARSGESSATYALRIRMPGDVIATKTRTVEGCGGNRIFVQGAVDSLSCLSPEELDKCDIVMRTDSDHLFRGFSYWMDSWVKDGRLDPTKKNVDLWEILHQAKESHRIRMEKVSRVIEDEEFGECRALLAQS